MGTLTSRKVALSACSGCGLVLVACGDDPGEGADECRYENGNTYMQEVNHCNTMRDQGVQCIVPAPPVCYPGLRRSQPRANLDERTGGG